MSITPHAFFIFREESLAELLLEGLKNESDRNNKLSSSVPSVYNLSGEQETDSVHSTCYSPQTLQTPRHNEVGQQLSSSWLGSFELSSSSHKESSDNILKNDKDWDFLDGVLEAKPKWNFKETTIEGGGIKKLSRKKRETKHRTR
jgi:hypothetical protein